MKYRLLSIILLSVCAGLFAQNVSLDQAVQASALAIETRLPKGAKAAVLTFTSASQAFSEYVIDEIATALSASMNLQVIDRQNTDAIRREFNIQFSGDVSDDEVKRVGQQLGAQYIVTGSLVDIGNAYRFRMAAINIETAVREGSSSLNININDPQVVFLLTGQRTTQTSTPEGLLYEIVDRRTVTITQYIGNDATVNIPSHILDFPVTTIGNYAFSNCDSLTSVTIPSSVTSIGYYAFGGYSLTSITVDSRNPVYASVDGVLFDKNIRTLITYPQGKNQRTYVIPSSVTSIGDYAFSNCSSFSVTIPSSVTTIGNYAFSFSESLTSITVDNRNPVYASVDGVLFDKNIRILIKYPQGKNQRTYVIPSSVTTIGYYAFWCCESLTSIIIPSSVTYIGSYAFSNCSLTSITIPNSVTIIGEDAFSGNQLTSVTIPNSVTFINWFAFRGNQLTSVTIPNSVTEIGAGAFAGNQLTSVTIPNSVTYIGGNSEPYGIGAFSNNRLTSVTIPNSVTSIGYGAFMNNQLTSVTIPNSVTEIGAGAFADNQLTSVTIPNSVTSIGWDAFENNQLTSVSIPNSVTIIGSGAFRGNRLVSITIGANVEMNSYNDSFDYGFDNFYYAQGRRAGTYTYRNYSWSRQ